MPNGIVEWFWYSFCLVFVSGFAMCVAVFSATRRDLADYVVGRTPAPNWWKKDLIDAEARKRKDEVE